MDINNAARAELSNNLRELTWGQQQQWHDSIWPHLSESLPDERLSVNTPVVGRRKGREPERSSAEQQRQWRVKKDWNVFTNVNCAFALCYVKLISVVYVCVCLYVGGVPVCVYGMFCCRGV